MFLPIWEGEDGEELGREIVEWSWRRSGGREEEEALLLEWADPGRQFSDHQDDSFTPQRRGATDMEER